MKKLMMFGIIVMILIGCGGGASSVEKAISQVDKAIEKLEKKKGNVTEEDWLAIEKEVEEPLKVISDALDNDKVGPMTKLKLVAVTARWATAIAQSGFGKMIEEKSLEFSKEIENASKEFENATKELEKAMAGQDSKD